MIINISIVQLSVINTVLPTGMRTSFFKNLDNLLIKSNKKFFII